MNRTEWTFEYPAGQVADGAARRARHHSERVDYWEKEIAKAERAIRAGGIDIRAYEHTGGRRNEVIIDPNLADRLSEAQNKRDSNERRAGEFADWAAVLGLDPEKMSRIARFPRV